jgi:peptide-methionine (S)-S-oxide reductase
VSEDINHHRLGFLAAAAATTVAAGPGVARVSAEFVGSNSGEGKALEQQFVQREGSQIMATTQKATFGAGCFWSVEAAFRQVPGVVDTAVGFAGGTTQHPTCEEVSSGHSGHAEVVEVEYDPEKVAYQRLLDVFWAAHDPTAPDVGDEYRSVIFFHTPEQEAAARASKELLDRSEKLGRPILTEIAPAPTFYRAEEYHQRYLERRGMARGMTA